MSTVLRYGKHAEERNLNLVGWILRLRLTPHSVGFSQVGNEEDCDMDNVKRH